MHIVFLVTLPFAVALILRPDLIDHAKEILSCIQLKATFRCVIPCRLGARNEDQCCSPRRMLSLFHAVGANLELETG